MECAAEAEAAKARVPLGRAGQAQDIANGVLFLASDASQLHDGSGAGNRRRYDGWRETSLALRLVCATQIFCLRTKWRCDTMHEAERGEAS
jgi:hypothetical protein